MRHIVSFALAVALSFGPRPVARADEPRASIASETNDDLTLALATSASILAIGGLVVMFIGLSYFEIGDSMHSPSMDGSQTADALIASGALSLGVGILLGVVAVMLDLDVGVDSNGVGVRF